MKALTLRPAWAWAVIFGGKNIENRSWYTAYRGPLVIHAGSSHGPHGEDDVEKIEEISGLVMPDEIDMRAAIGLVELVHVEHCAPYVQACDSPWAAQGGFHWTFENPRAFSHPVDYKGSLRLWEFPNVLISASRLSSSLLAREYRL